MAVREEQNFAFLKYLTPFPYPQPPPSPSLIHSCSHFNNHSIHQPHSFPACQCPSLSASSGAIAVDGFDFIRGCTFHVGCPMFWLFWFSGWASIVCCCCPFMRCILVLLMLLLLLLRAFIINISFLRYYLLLLKNVYPQLRGKLDCNFYRRQILFCSLRALTFFRLIVLARSLCGLMLMEFTVS